jgi:adenosyl cobinamide kinase/adenosyl cobinamide phosphate guanylyltransferase/ribosomal protein S18 acetylase RimI-like enzyme
VLASGLEPVYLATAEALDDEMRARVDHHRARRGDRWRVVVEEPLDLAGALRASAGPGRAVLVDCLTLWLTNVLLAGREPDAEAERLAAAAADLPGPAVLVSNEVGQGVVPANALARRFVDEAGRLHQRLAAAADEVVLVTAGLPLRLKRHAGLGEQPSRAGARAGGDAAGERATSLELALTDAPDPRAKEAAGAALHRHNVDRTGTDDRRPVAALALDPGSGEVVGGLWGRTELGLLFLDMLFLPASLRGRGAGGRLLGMVEDEARRRGCRNAVVETSSFQAPGFYQRHGYAEFGRVPFGVGGEARVFLRKPLA